MNKHSKNVVKFYNGRGTAEQWIKEGKNAVKWTKLSCRTFKDNQTRLQLFALAYNLANFLRRLALRRDVEHRLLTTLREKLVKIGAKVGLWRIEISRGVLLAVISIDEEKGRLPLGLFSSRMVYEPEVRRQLEELLHGNEADDEAEDEFRNF